MKRDFYLSPRSFSEGGAPNCIATVDRLLRTSFIVQ